ncbi:MAG: leucine-rich repeat domain-containing protein [Clostridia bacterium]
MSTTSPGFTRLPHNLYYDGSPILICSATLHKTGLTSGAATEILKMRSASNKIIKSVQVEIVQQSNIGANIGDRISYTYENLNCAPDAFFGEDVSIPLPALSVYTVYIHIMKVTFEDGSAWDGFGKHFEPLNPPTPLEKDSFAKDYKAIFGDQCKYIFEVRSNLWVCPCGNYNGLSEEKCPNCGIEIKKLKEITPAVVRAKAKELLQQKRKETDAKVEKISKKATIIGSIIGAIILAVVVCLFMYNTYILPSNVCKNALAYAENGDIVSAEEQFNTFEDPSTYISRGDFVDTVVSVIPQILDDDSQVAALARLIKMCNIMDKNTLYYALGVAYADIGKNEQAIYILGEAKYYEDAEDIINDLEDVLAEQSEEQTELDYKAALVLVENGDYEAASEALNALDDYKDALDYYYVCKLVEYQEQYDDIIFNNTNADYEDTLDDFEDLIEDINYCYKNISNTFNTLCESLGTDNFEVLRADVYSSYLSRLIIYGEEDDVISYGEEIGFILQPEKSSYSGSTYWIITGYTDTDATYVNIPTAIDSIADYAFSNCTKIEEVSIYESYVNTLAFENTAWMKNMKDEIVILENGTLFFYPNVTSTTGEIEIPDGVKYINYDVFKNGVMDSVVFPDSLLCIFDEAFIDCDNLVEVNIPEGVENISDNAFYGCDMLSTVTLPSTLVYLDDTSFGNCPELLEITINQASNDLGMFVDFSNSYTVKYTDTEEE